MRDDERREEPDRATRDTGGAVSRAAARAVTAERSALADVDPALPAASAEAEEALRAAVRAYTWALRATGLPPERVLLLVKRILREASTGAEPRRGRALVDRAAEWCIAAYFDNPDVPPTAPPADGPGAGD